MKKLLLIISLFMVVTVNAQTPEIVESNYESYAPIEPINPVIYLSAMNRMFRLDTLCSNEILVTHIKGNKIKNKYLTYSEIRTYLTKKYYKTGEKKFKLSTETNNGYVLVFGQFSKDPDIPIRYFTIFVDETTKRINVIEIQEN